MADSTDALALLPPGFVLADGGDSGALSWAEVMGPCVAAAEQHPDNPEQLPRVAAIACPIVSFVPGIPDPSPLWLLSVPHIDVAPDAAWPIARAWLVEASFAWGMVPAAQRFAVRAIMRGGQSIMVCGYCHAAVIRAVAGLHRLRIFDGDGGWCGHG